MRAGGGRAKGRMASPVPPPWAPQHSLGGAQTEEKPDNATLDL